MKLIKVLMIAGLFFCGMINSKAMESERISYIKLNNIYYNQEVSGKFMSNHVTAFKLGERYAYCIEPGVDINERYYDVYNDWSNINLSDLVKEKIEKVGYYGYEYPGHQTDNYYIATQELIWKEIDPTIKVNWTTGINNSGDVIDVSKEKEEIINLVNKGSLLPSFTNEVIKGKVSDTIVLEDKNNVLENYEISESKNHKIEKVGNKLYITFNKDKVDNEEVTLKRKYYDKEPLLIYSKGNSQKLAALRISLDKDAKFTLENYEEIDVPDTLSDININLFLIVSFICMGIYVYVKKA